VHLLDEGSLEDARPLILEALARHVVDFQVEMEDIALRDAVLVARLRNRHYRVDLGQASLCSVFGVLLHGYLFRLLLDLYFVAHSRQLSPRIADDARDRGHSKDLACAEMRQAELNRLVQHELLVGRQPILLTKDPHAVPLRVTGALGLLGVG